MMEFLTKSVELVSFHLQVFPGFVFVPPQIITCSAIYVSLIHLCFSFYTWLCNSKKWVLSVVLLLLGSNRNFQGSYLYALRITQHYHQGSSPLLLLFFSLFCLLIFHSNPLQLPSSAQATITKFCQSLYSMFLSFKSNERFV